METINLFNEVLLKYSVKELADILSLHQGTIKRWIINNSVPDNYYIDLNLLLDNKYPSKEEYRDKDQFYTSSKTAKYCYKKTLKVLKELQIDVSNYIFIEPSAGCCNFFKLLPKDKRIGIDIDPKGELKDELVEFNYLTYNPPPNKKYIVIGNPPFGLRGNLALRFINHSYDFADVVAFILPPLFNSTGKGVPMTRVRGYKLAYTENLPKNSFEYPDGTPVDVATIFQIWTKVNTEKITTEPVKKCDSFVKVYSLSDGGTPASTRNKNMLEKCDVYLPSTCFKGMQAYDSFYKLPNRRGYGIVFFKEKSQLMKLFFKSVNWNDIAFTSTNGAKNLRTDLILNVLIERGYYDN